MPSRQCLSTILSLIVLVVSCANAITITGRMQNSSVVRNTTHLRNATFQNSTTQSPHAAPIKQTPKVEESEAIAKRNIQPSTFVYYIQQSGCSVQKEGGDDYRFTSDCTAKKFLKAIKDATQGPDIDIYEKTRKTIDPNKCEIPNGSGLRFYERDYSFGVMTRVFNKERIILNDKLALDKDGNFAFVFEQDKNDEANDFIQFGAQSSNGDFSGVKGTFYCNFFIKRGDESDFDFKFFFNGKTIQEGELKGLLNYDPTKPLGKARRRSISDSDEDNDDVIIKPEVSRWVEKFYVDEKLQGYISNEGFWFLYFAKDGLNFRNQKVKKELANKADSAALICSNNAFEGKTDTACATAMIINEANIQWYMFTEVQPWVIRGLKFFQVNANILLTWTQVGMPSFKIPPSMNFEAYLLTGIYNERDYTESIYYIDEGTTIRSAIEYDGLDNLFINRRKYTKVFFDINCNREYVVITAKPALNCTCNTLREMLPEGTTLRNKICDLVGENVFAFENLKITKYGAIDLNLGPAEDMTLVDDNSKVRNTKLRFRQANPRSPLVDMEGQGQEKICGTKTMLGMRRLGETNQAYMTGNMAMFEASDLQERCSFHFASNKIKNQHGCLKKFPLMKLKYSFIMSSKDSYFEFDTLLNGLDLVGQIVQCNNRNQASLALEQTNGALTDLMKVLYKDKEIDMGALPLYASSCILCFQNNGRFYEKYTGDEEKEIKCLAVANYFKQVKKAPIYNDDVMIYLSSLDFSKCPEGTLGRACRSFIKGFNLGDSKILPSECFGKLERNGFSLSCEIDEPFQLVDGMTVEGDEQRPLKLHVGVHWREVEGKTEYTITGEMQGFFCTKDTKRQDGISVFLKFKKDGLYLTIPRPFRSIQATFLNMDILVETVVKAWEYQLPENLEYIQMNSDLRINGIDIKAQRGLTQQYVYSSKNQNKYYIFDSISQAYLIDKVYETFKIDPSGSVLAGCQIKEVGFAGYQGSGYWKIEEFDLRIKKGTWMVGKATCQKSNPDLPMKNSGPIDVKIKLDGGKVTEYFEMLPILVGKAINKKKKKVDYLFSMTKTDKTTNVGPYMVMQYKGSEMTGGRIEGYIKCVGYEGYGSLKIESLKPFKVTMDLSKSEKRSPDTEDAQFVAGLQLRGEIKGENSKFEYQIDGATLKEKVSRSFEETMKKSTDDLTEGFKNNTDNLNNIKEKIEPYQRKKAAARKRLEILSENLINYQREQRESEEFMRSKCLKNCNLVHTPGFKWTENCAISKRFVNASCISFSKDAHVAGDVNCVAKCEIQKADTRQLMQSKAKDAKVQIREHKADSDLTTILEQLEEATALDISVLQKITDKKSKDEEAVKSLHSKLKVKSIKTNGWQDLRKVKKPFSTNLKILAYKGAKLYYLKKNFLLVGNTDKLISDYYVEIRNGKVLKKLKEQNFDAVIKAELINNNIDVWKMRNKEEIDFMNSKKRVVIPEHKLDREEPMEMDPQLSSLYTPQELHNEAMVKNFAPWHVLKNNDPIKTMATVNKTAKREKIVYKNDCHATRSKINEFSDMVAYMKTWTRAYNAGKMIEPLVKRNVDEGLKNMTLDTNKIHKRSAEKPTKRDILASKWTNTLQTGFTEWGKEFSRQLAAVNTMGPKIIKEELSAMFVTSPKETLESYIETSSAHADVAFKKSFVSKNKPFTEISKNFINHLKSDKTLEELAPLVSEWDGMIRSVDKRTISCHDEL